MKVWQAVIASLLLVILPIVGACSVDKPSYSSDEVVTVLKQAEDLSDAGSLTQDRYGAKLLGKPIILNLRLDDWKAKYLGGGKWQVSAEARYKEGRDTQTCEFVWNFYEDTNTVECIGGGGECSL
ncbi:hypothetical protein ACFLYR_08720 [Chloroflexota bacterium]